MDPRSFTDTYGPRIHPITGRSSFHTGIDISASAGTPVIAPSNAVLADLNPGDSIYGNQLILAHNKNVETMYGHLNSYAPGLKPGMKIRAGDLIGYVGSTGLSTGPHLHWETWRDGNPVNPVSFLGG
jgi:murein DD-endopeptidase MepM/ murein hydrolase activator NlpD